MNFLELASARYSCRSFKDKRVENELILKILEAGRVAPSAKNLQPTKVLVVTEEENLEKIKLSTKCGWSATTFLIVMYDKESSWKRIQDGMDEGIVDASIVATHMMLQIEDLGLGTTWIGSFDPSVIKREFNLKDSYEVVCLLPVGYKSDDSKPLEMHYNRKDLKEFVIFDKE